METIEPVSEVEADGDMLTAADGVEVTHGVDVAHGVSDAKGDKDAKDDPDTLIEFDGVAVLASEPVPETDVEGDLL